MNLIALQTSFRDEIIADDDGLAPSSTGMAIYRDAYRGRLLGALEKCYARTRRWTSDDLFTDAACHFILSNPPRGWTLDEYGRDFPELLQTLFADDPEVAELAWLEWHMQQAFAAPDAVELDPAMLASAGLSESDWGELSFSMAAGFVVRAVTTNCSALWTALTDGDAKHFAPQAANDEHLMVWRKALSPQFRTVDQVEYAALAGLAAGQTLGRISAGLNPDLLGNWLAGWLGQGLFSSFKVADA